MTIAWNLIEAVIAISAGIAAGSVTLAGFGFDSKVEVLSAFVVAWQLRAELRGAYDARDQLALRFIAARFHALAIYG